jgi:PKD repeat protein
MARQVLIARKMVDPWVVLLMIMALLVGFGGWGAVGTSAQRPRPFCFSDELLSRSLRQNPALQRKMDEQERVIRNYVESRRARRSRQSTTTNLIIPVVVYVVHLGTTPLNTNENISDAQVNSQIEALNNAFSLQGVKFCLATKEGSTLFPVTGTPGIIRIASGLTNHLTSQEIQLKTLAPPPPLPPSLPGDRYLRIWVVKDIDNNSGVAGYARFPGTVPLALDGIVMRHDVFGNKNDSNCGCPNLLLNYDQGKILAHEVAHYLNLYHTFHGGCTGLFPADCAANGDMVCDTPQIAAANTGCPGPPGSCTGAAALIANHMDYTDDTCRNAFTTDQASRMVGTINTLRPLLISAQNLIYTGVGCTGGVNAAFSADNYNPCTGQAVTFNALPSTGATYAWDFGDGSSTSSATFTVQHQYSTAGTYTVTLTVTSGNNTVSSTDQIFVTNCAPITSSQGNWYFGYHAGLNFSSGLPLPALGALISTQEGSISQSDSSGNLLFYSDGIKVWNKTHAPINPTPLTGSGTPSQAALSVPVPGNPLQYYLFTIPDKGQNIFAYSLVDISVTGGNTSMMLANTNIPIQLPPGANYIAEAATAVQKCNGNGDYWVIVRGSPGDGPQLEKSFYVYSVTASGVLHAGTYPVGIASQIGQLKMSPDGTLIASIGNQNAVGSNYAAVCDFDRATGVVGNNPCRYFNKGAYGITFSPNSRVLYIVDSGGPQQTLYQYDLLHPNPLLTERVVATVPVNQSTLQIGPNGKVYLSLWSQMHLAVINFPDNLVSVANPNACGFSYNGPSLITSSTQVIYSYLGLPNMIDALPPAQVPNDFYYVTSSCSSVKFSAPACAPSYAWNFGDGTTSSVQNPTHTYATNGTYTVTLTLNGITKTHTVTIGIPALATTIFGPSQVCPANVSPPFYNYSVNAQPGLAYSWALTGGTIPGVSNGDNVDVKWNTLPGTVQLTVTDTASGCSVTTTLNIVHNCNPNQCIIPPAGMVNWWTFDETSGTTAQDLTGAFNNVGTHFNGPLPGNGPLPVAGIVDGALSFNWGDYVEVPNHPELNFGTCILDVAEPMTIDLWVKTDLPTAQQGTNSGLLTILDKRVNPNHPTGYHLFIDNGRLGFQMDGVNYVAPASGPNHINIADNQWHFVAVSLPMCRGFGGGFLYVDGQSVLNLPRGPGFTNNAKLYIGAPDPAFVTGLFKGSLDELEIYKSALNANDLYTIFAARNHGKCKVDCSASPSPCRKLPGTKKPPVRR